MSFFKTNCIVRPINIRRNEWGDGGTKQSHYCQQSFFLKGKPSLIAEVSVITVSKVQLPTPLFIFYLFCS